MTDFEIAKIAAQMTQQVQSNDPIVQESSMADSARNAAFQEIMESQRVAEAQANDVAENVVMRAHEHVDSALLSDTDPPFLEKVRLEEFVQSMLSDEEQIKAMMQRCMDGEAMSQQDLLRMQALIYAYSQKVELSAKVVEKATGGIKQLMNTQV